MFAQPTAPAFDTEGLRSLVREHRIRYQTAAEKAVVEGGLRAIGLRLELSAVHAHPSHPPMPGCPECGPVIAALKRVVDAVVPKDHRPSNYEVSVPPASLRYNSHGEPEIIASVTILHDEGINDPVDACETRCLAEMVSRLKDLGARPDQS